MGTSPALAEEARLDAFRAGWSHTYCGAEAAGYFIGRPHPPYTEVKVVRSVDEGEAGYFEECAEGEPGQLVTRGENVMAGYVGDAAATAKALRDDGWYLNLGDRDFYWRARDSALLIKGGANYSFEQINSELSAFLAAHYGLGDGSLAVAVVGLRLASEHEDECCATVELAQEAEHKRGEMERTLLAACAKGVSKGSKPDRVRFAPIPRNFKGAIQLPALREEWKRELAAGSK